MKRLLLISLALALLLSSCLAEAFSGVTFARDGISVTTRGGTVSKVCVEAGQFVKKGDVLIEMRTDKLFATQDGTIAQITAKEGDEVSGEFMTLNPLSPYAVYCSVSDAYSTVDTKTIHIGETVYIKCTKNGTHRAVGVITSIDGKEYHVVTTGGELYLGETVYIYRDPDFSYKQRIGIATVVVSDSESYQAEGVIHKLYVEDGDYVERGQLLCEYAKSAQTVITASEDGIVTDLAVAVGDTIEKDQSVMTIVPPDRINARFTAEEAQISSLHIGDTVAISYANDPLETEYPAIVKHISSISGESGFTVEVDPQNEIDFIGLGVIVYTD